MLSQVHIIHSAEVSFESKTYGFRDPLTNWHTVSRVGWFSDFTAKRKKKKKKAVEAVSYKTQPLLGQHPVRTSPWKGIFPSSRPNTHTQTCICIFTERVLVRAVTSQAPKREQTSSELFVSCYITLWETPEFISWYLETQDMRYTFYSTEQLRY